MTKPNAPTTKDWFKTACFMLFNKHHQEQCRLFWTHQVGRGAMKRHSLTLGDLDPIISKGDSVHTDSGFPVEPKRLPETAKRFRDLLPARAGMDRLNLLVMCSANLEWYLKRAVRLHVWSQPSKRNASGFSKTGKADLKCVGRDSVAAIVAGVESLLAITFDQHKAVWQRCYKLRCAAAHDGGIVTPRTLADIPDIGLAVGERITLSTEDLMEAWVSAWEIAARVDEKISSEATRKIEFEQHVLSAVAHDNAVSIATLKGWLMALGFQPLTADCEAALRDKGTFRPMPEDWRVSHSTKGMKAAGRRVAK